jgi:hypothetical protein
MRRYLLICCVLGVACLGCGKSSEPQAVRNAPVNRNDSENSARLPEEFNLYHASASRADHGSGPEVRLDAITFTAPATWKRTKPASSYYLAEFTLPHVDKDTTNGRVLVSVGSGSIESNLDVFKGEFDTQSENVKQEQKEIAGFRITFLDVSGAYTVQHSQAPAATQAGYRMIVVVIPVGDQLHFVKVVGPQQTIAANLDSIDTFVRSVQRRSPDAVATEAAGGIDAVVRIRPLTLTAPPAWKRTTPRSSLVQAEFAFPHADKDSADGRLTVSVVAGTIKDNVERWKGQFIGAIEKPRQEENEIAGLKVTLVDFSGTFGDQAGMMAPVVNRPAYRMVAAIIPIGDQLYVIKAVGPQQTMAANIDAINSFLGSLKRDG